MVRVVFAVPDQESTVLNRELGYRLRDAMTAAGFNGRQFAQRLGRDEGAVSYWLAGKRPIPEADLGAILTVCGVPHQNWAPWLWLVNARSAATPLRLSGERRANGYRDHLSTAERVVEFAATHIPWLAQTPDYTAELTGMPPFTPAAELLGLTPAMSGVRETGRQRGPWVMLLVHEWALGTPVGDAAVIGAQWSHLMWLADLRHVQLRVIPADAATVAACGAVAGSFGFVTSKKHRPTVLRHEPDMVIGCDDPSYVDGYERTVGELVALAWDADTSRKFITRVLADIHAHQPNTLIATGSGE
jgi:transcriptional regulator with XRE-family HTH domain